MKKDVRESVRFFKMAIRAGETEAYEKLGVLLHYGDKSGAVAKDTVEADDMYHNSIKHVPTSSIVYLGVLMQYRDHQDAVKKDESEPEQLFRCFIDAGHTGRSSIYTHCCTGAMKQAVWNISGV